MIPETEWKFFEATEQRAKHLSHHVQEQLLALWEGKAPPYEAEDLAGKRARLIQEMEYPERIEKALASEPTDSQARHLSLHQRFVLATVFDTHPEIVPLMETLQGMYARFQPTVNDKPATWGEIQTLIASHEDRDVREAAWCAGAPLAQVAQEPLSELFRCREALARAVLESGYPHVAYFLQDHERTEVISDLDTFERTMREDYRATKKTVRQATGEHDVEPWDFVYGIRSGNPIPDSAFPAEALVDAMQVQARRWGFEPTNLGIRVQAYEGPARLVALEVPKNLVVLVPNHGGWQTYADAFRVFGSALYYASARSKRHFLEHECLAVAQSLGVLFASVLENREWLSEHTGAPAGQIGAAVRARKAERLVQLKLAHSHHAFENIIYAHGDTDANKLYCDIYEQGMEVSRKPEPLWAADPNFAFAPFAWSERVLSALAGHQIRKTLTGSFGEEAWKEPKVAEWFTEHFFQSGASLPWRKKIEQATGSEIELDALREDLGTAEFIGPGLEESEGISDEEVAEYFEGIDLSDIE